MLGGIIFDEHGCALASLEWLVCHLVVTLSSFAVRPIVSLTTKSLLCPLDKPFSYLLRFAVATSHNLLSANRCLQLCMVWQSDPLVAVHYCRSIVAAPVAALLLKNDHGTSSANVFLTI